MTTSRFSTAMSAAERTAQTEPSQAGVGEAPILEIIDIHKSFGQLNALDGVNLSVQPGEVVCIIGPSGCGKTTLLRCITFLVQPDSGRIFLSHEPVGMVAGRDGRLRRGDERAVNRMRARIGMVYQSLNVWPHLSVLDNVMRGPMLVLEQSKSQAEGTARRMLERVGLSDKVHSRPGELSGGQKQRVAIARALAMDPELMLFDEPTSALDPELVREVLAVIRELASGGMTMLIVTHELGFARWVADRIVFMDKGRIVEEGPPAELLGAPRTDRLREFLSLLQPRL